MYDADLHLFANPLQRYAIGDRTPALRHGPRAARLTVYLQSAAPGPGQRGQLAARARAGASSVTLRLYVPSRAAAAGQWSPPGITCLDCRP